MQPGDPERIGPYRPVPADDAPGQRPPVRARSRFRDFARTPLGAVILSVPLAAIIAVGVLAAFPGHASPIATLTDPGGSANPGNSNVSSLAIARDGTTLAAGSGSRSTYLWNLKTRTITATLTAPNAFDVNAVAFSPDGTTLAVGDANGTTTLWSTATGTLTATLTGPATGFQVQSVAFSPDGTTLAAGDQSGAVYLWNVATRKIIATFNPGNKIPADGLAFDPDGTTLATSGGNDDIYLWKLPSHTS